MGSSDAVKVGKEEEFLNYYTKGPLWLYFLLPVHKLLGTRNNNNIIRVSYCNRIFPVGVGRMSWAEPCLP